MKKEFVIPEGKELDIRGTKLFVREIGLSSQPSLLVLHGGPGGNHEKLLPLREFSSNYHIVFYDQRGTGKSHRFDIDPTKPKLDLLSLEQNIEDIESLRIKLGKEKISIIGHSWGGALAIFYAAKYPSRVEKMIIYSGGPEDLFLCEEKEKKHSSKRTSKENELIKTKTAQLKEALGQGQSQDVLDEIYTELIGIAYPSLYHRYALCTSKLEKCGFWSNLGAGSYIDSFDRLAFAKDLKLIDCPTLLIWGRHEPSPQERLLYLLDHIQNSQFVIFENSGHNAMEEEPELFFKTLWAFLKDTSLPIKSFRSREDLIDGK